MNASISRDDLTSLFVKDFIEAQNNAGLTPAFLATSLKRLIRAKKTDTFKGEIETEEALLGPDGNPIMKQANGPDGGPIFLPDGTLQQEPVTVHVKKNVVIYSKPMEDNATRRLALQMALNIRGIQTTSPTTQVNIDKPGSVNLMGYVAQVLGEEDGGNGES